MTSSFESHDLRHYDAGEGELPPHLRRRVRHLTELCRFATRGPSGPPRPTTVRCRKRPGRKPCTGLLTVRLRDLPSAAVEWHCPICGSEGRIIGWQQTDAERHDVDADPDDESFLEVTGDDTKAVMNQLLGLDDWKATEFVPKREPRPRSTTPAALARSTFRIKVSLRHVRPPIWRRLLVPGDISLPELHQVLQCAMGWYDSHLHMFDASGYGFAPVQFEIEDAADSSQVELAELSPREGCQIDYEYDFGDGWNHSVVVEEILAEPCTEARCIKGRRACPPEDCGGPPGYARLLEALADPANPEHEELRDWAPPGFDPEEFDVMATDAKVRTVLRRS